MNLESSLNLFLQNTIQDKGAQAKHWQTCTKKELDASEFVQKVIAGSQYVSVKC